MLSRASLSEKVIKPADSDLITSALFTLVSATFSPSNSNKLITLSLAQVIVDALWLLIKTWLVFAAASVMSNTCRKTQTAIQGEEKHPAHPEKSGNCGL